MACLASIYSNACFLNASETAQKVLNVINTVKFYRLPTYFFLWRIKSNPVSINKTLIDKKQCLPLSLSKYDWWNHVQYHRQKHDILMVSCQKGLRMADMALLAGYSRYVLEDINCGNKSGRERMSVFVWLQVPFWLTYIDQTRIEPGERDGLHYIRLNAMQLENKYTPYTKYALWAVKASCLLQWILSFHFSTLTYQATFTLLSIDTVF